MPVQGTGARHQAEGTARDFKIRDFNQKRFFKKLRNWNKVITVSIILELESLKFIGFFTYFEDFIGFNKVESVFIAYSFFLVSKSADVSSEVHL